MINCQYSFIRLPYRPLQKRCCIPAKGISALAWSRNVKCAFLHWLRGKGSEGLYCCRFDPNSCKEQICFKPIQTDCQSIESRSYVHKSSVVSETGPSLVTHEKGGRRHIGLIVFIWQHLLHLQKLFKEIWPRMIDLQTRVVPFRSAPAGAILFCRI